VHVAAFTPDSGQSALSLLATLPAPPPINNYLVFDSTQSFTWISDEGIARAFAQLLPPLEQEELAVTQGITATAGLPAIPTVTPAWKSKPSWFVVSQYDDVITANLEKEEAATIEATSIELPTCHVAMLQEPEHVANFIISAAESFNRH
jgi:pimeloyl-ACP methyl ester carboxylesterase